MGFGEEAGKLGGQTFHLRVERFAVVGLFLDPDITAGREDEVLLRDLGRGDDRAEPFLSSSVPASYRSNVCASSAMSSAESSRSLRETIEPIFRASMKHVLPFCFFARSRNQRHAGICVV